MITLETYDFTICKHYPYLIEYGVFEGVDGNDEELVNKFINKLNSIKEELGATHYIIAYESDADCHFRICEICNLYGDCIEATVTFYN